MGKSLRKKMEDTDRERGEEYEAEKGKERAFDWKWCPINYF